MMLRCYFDSTSSSLLGNYFEVPRDMHTARPPVHTPGAGTEQATSSSLFGERSFYVQEKACLWFAPSFQVKELSWKSPFLRGLAWALVSCAVSPTVSWTRDILSTEYGSRGLARLQLKACLCGYNIELLGCFWPQGSCFCLWGSGMVHHPDPRCEIGFHGNQLIRRSPRSPTHNQVHDIQVQKLLRIWKPQQQSMAASAGSF